MKSEKMSGYAQKIGLYIAVLTIFLNFCALVWNIHQTNIQRDETTKLAVLTAQLDDRVNLLAASLDQEISRLHRLNVLVSSVFESSVMLNQRMQQGKQLDVGVEDTEGFEAEPISIVEITELNVNIETLRIEMIAIARVTGDGELLSLVDQYRQTMPSPHEFTTQEDWLERLEAFRKAASALHERVYQLLETATQIDCKPLRKPYCTALHTIYSDTKLWQ